MVEPVETYTTEWQTQAEMTYDGLGNRLQMTAYADGQSLTTQYELDNGRVLSADAAGNITFYLYGLGPIGELTNDWNYSLPDGGNTPRQLADVNGEVTFAASYTPWGDTLETYGTGRFTQGYFGGIMDAATGLIYVGNGQYYDPATGRFLTRDARPNQNNPYTPIDPTGALLGPLALLALAYGRKKSRGKWDMLVILLVLGLSLGMGLAACGQPTTATIDTPTATAIATVTPSPTGTVAAAITVTPKSPETNDSPDITPTMTCTATLTPSPTPGWRSLSIYNMSAYYITHETQYYSRNSLSGPIPSLDKIHANKYFLFSEGGVCMQGTGRLKDGKLIGCLKRLNWSVHETIENEYGKWEYKMPPENPPRENTPFFWKTENDIKNFVAFETVAVCNNGIIPRGSEIRIPGIMAALKKDANFDTFSELVSGKDDIFKVTDVGGGLCSSNGIDIFIGEQEPFSNRRSPTDRAYSAIMRLPDMLVEVR